MRAVISVLLIALLNALPVTQVLAQAQQQQPRTTQVQDSVPWLPSSLQDRAWKPVALTVPRADSGTVLLTGSGLSYPGTLGLALDANTRSRDASGNPMPLGTGGKIAIVVGAVLVVAAVVIAVIVSNIEGN